MDQTDVCLEIIDLICATLLFIDGVVNSYPTSALSTKSFNQAHIFLQAFSDLCFSDVTGFLRDHRIPSKIISDVERSLHSFNKTLASHREAWRYVKVASEAQQQAPATKRTSTITSDLGSERRRRRDEMKKKSQIWGERTDSNAFLILFDQEAMDSLHSACNVWTARLRHTISTALLIAGDTSPHFPTAKQSTEIGIAQMLGRQRRQGLRPSDNYMPLTGKLKRTPNTSQSATGLQKTIYNDGSDEVDVMIEARLYTQAPLILVRQLTWLLAASPEPTQTSRNGTSLEEYDMLALRCLGYMDDPTNQRSFIVYRSPQSHPWASNPPSLHDQILKGLDGKLSLDRRFQAARILATSVIDIHTSGTVHGDITAHNIAMMPRIFHDNEPSPFLVGFAVEPFDAQGPLYLASNIYRHESQFGKPSDPRVAKQDIYSLGVVLLEIALWKTMSTVFGKLLQPAPRFEAKDAMILYRRVNRVIVDLAHGPSVRREMGERYAIVVQTCLKWRYDDPCESLIEFRKEVVDVLSKACNL